MSANDKTKVEVEDLLQSLVEDIFEFVKIVSEENSTKAYNIVLGTKEEAVRTVKTLVGGMVLSPANYFKILNISAKIARVSGKFVKANADVLLVFNSKTKSKE